MKLSVGCTLGYQIATPQAAFTFNVLANTDAQQRLVSETITCTPAVPWEIVEHAKAGRALRCEAPAGAFELRYSAIVELERPPLPALVRADNPGRLPLSILTYTLPSRYCESDRFSQIAWELFGKTEDRAEQVRAICRWVDQKLAYAPGASDSRTSAWDVWISRQGVCRDYTHLAIAFCRALSIPARYVGAYAVGLQPMDFHACFEAYLGGDWRLFDPTDDIAPDRIVVMSRGRDATSAALTTIFGRVSAAPITVTCDVMTGEVGVTPPA
ncbi:transglutaminase-like domain-containing protein [Horticoccus sp. 23ND18S-11]|uniref:transglutaminase-like domain-containing protein n=1 Tax=Horticoccus sp. 23ND18S-11 TaxID=3391832 RepID=UPI0039C9E81D